ncbi:YIP1 family protein [Thermodesulfobacteriota bacterium]
MSMDWAVLKEKMIRAARLEPGLYQEVGQDDGANQEAFAVVALAGVAQGISLAKADLFVEAGALKGFAIGVFGGITSWFFWALIIYFIGVRLLNHRSDMNALLRCLGFAAAPGVLKVFAMIPGIAIPLQLGIAVWMLATFIVAVRQALGVDTRRAVLVSSLGFLLYLMVFLLLMSIGVSI